MTKSTGSTASTAPAPVPGGVPAPGAGVPAAASPAPAAASPGPAAVPPRVLAAIGEGIPVRVAAGSHPVPGDEACLMELASAFACDPWSDHPASVHPVLAAVARAVNDRVSDGAREFLAPLVPSMTGTAWPGPGGRCLLDRSARIVVACTREALGLTPFMAAEMESARLTALSVLSAVSRPGGPPGPAEPAANPRERAEGTTARRAAAALLGRAGLLRRVYPGVAAIQAVQAVSVIAGECAGPAVPRDARLGRLLRACAVLCQDTGGSAGAAAAGHRDANAPDMLPA